MGMFWVSGFAAAFPVHAQDGGVQVDNTAPQWVYTGTTNGSSIEWEIGGVFTASWTITEENPYQYSLFWNQTGVNTTHSSGVYTTEVSGTYNPILSDVGNTFYIQMNLNDTVNNQNSSIVYFTVTNTNDPSLTVTNPQNRTYSSAQVQVEMSSSSYDLALMWWSIYYSNGTLWEGNTTYISSIERDLTNGVWRFMGYANDTAGLEVSVTVWFTVAIAFNVAGSPGFVPPSAAEQEVEYVSKIGKNYLPILAFGIGAFVLVYHSMERKLKPAQTRRDYQKSKKEPEATTPYYNKRERGSKVNKNTTMNKKRQRRLDRREKTREKSRKRRRVR
jgi:hypothetical protein